MYLLQIWHLTFNKLQSYMRGHIEFRVVKDFLLQQLFLGLFVHVFFEEVKRRVGFLCFDGPAETRCERRHGALWGGAARGG